MTSIYPFNLYLLPYLCNCIDRATLAGLQERTVLANVAGVGRHLFLESSQCTISCDQYANHIDSTLAGLQVGIPPLHWEAWLGSQKGFPLANVVGWGAYSFLEPRQAWWAPGRDSHHHHSTAMGEESLLRFNCIDEKTLAGFTEGIPHF